MTVADVRNVVVSQAFYRKARPNILWRALSDDRSVQLVDGMLKIPQFDNKTVFNTVALTGANGQLVSTDASDYAWPTPNINQPTQLLLAANVVKSFNEFVSRLSIDNVSIGLLAERSMHIGLDATEEINKEIRDYINARRTGGTSAVAAINRTAIATSSANWGNAAHLTAIKDEFREMSVVADGLNWDDMGRTCVVSPDVYDLVREKLITDKHFLVRGATDDAVLNGMIRDYYGWDVLKDRSPGSGHTNTDDAKHTMFWMVRGRGFYFGADHQRMGAVDGYSVGAHMGTYIRGDFQIGFAITNNDRIRLTPHNIS